jgi:tetratricopeptide (TPR) repeat protein
LVSLSTDFLGTAIGSLASTFSALGRLHDALALQQEALEFNRRVLSENHPNIGLACYNVSSIYAQTGESVTAMEFMHEALRVWTATLPASHPRVLLAQEQLRKIQENLA